MRRHRTLLVTTCVTAALSASLLAAAQPAQAANPVPGDTISGTGSYSRPTTSPLTYANLMSRDSASLIDLSGFALPASNVGVPQHGFNRTLNLSNTSRSLVYGLRQDTNTAAYFTNAANTSHRTLPTNMAVEFVTNGTFLIPVKQDIKVTGHFWNFIAGAGRIWRETTDNGYDRASFPFALVESNQNCTHNGVMTFLWNPNATTKVSNVRAQISSETCKYHKFDLRGEVYGWDTAASVSTTTQEQLRNDYAAEVGARLPTKSISVLKADNGNPAAFDPTAFGRAESGKAGVPEMSEYGVLVTDPTNGNALTNYVSGCATRNGEYPYCAEMRLPSYSLAKSALTGTAYMWLMQNKSTATQTEKVGLHIPALPDTWDGVTIDNALDMANGHYASDAYSTDPAADEASTAESNHLLSVSYANHVSTAGASYFTWRNNPGQRFVYQSHSSFLAMRAMTRYHGSDLVPALWNEVYGPGRSNLSKGAFQVLRTDNAQSMTSNDPTTPVGQAKGSHGMWFNRDDIAKVARLHNNWNGVVNGTRELHQGSLEAALKRSATDNGLPTGRPSDANETYSNGFWATRHTAPTGCTYTSSRMSGYGGNIAVMTPNGATYWFFSDNNHFNWQDGVAELHDLRPNC